MSNSELTLYQKVQTLANLNHTTGLLLLVMDFLDRHFKNMVDEAKVRRSLKRKNYFSLEKELLLKMAMLCNMKCGEENVIIVNACMQLIGYDGYNDKKKHRFRQFVERVLRVSRKKNETKAMAAHFSARCLRNKGRSVKHESVSKTGWCHSHVYSSSLQSVTADPPSCVHHENPQNSAGSHEFSERSHPSNENESVHSTPSSASVDAPNSLSIYVDLWH